MLGRVTSRPGSRSRTALVSRKRRDVERAIRGIMAIFGIAKRLRVITRVTATRQR